MITPFTDYLQLAKHFFDIFDEVSAGPDFVRVSAIAKHLSLVGAPVKGQWRALRVKGEETLIEAIAVDEGGTLFHGKGASHTWDEIARAHGAGVHDWVEKEASGYDPLDLRWIGERAYATLSKAVVTLEGGIRKHYTYTFGQGEAVSDGQKRAVELFELLGLEQSDAQVKHFLPSIVGRQLAREGLDYPVRTHILRCAKGIFTGNMNMAIEALEMEGLLVNKNGIYQDWEEVRKHILLQQSRQLIGYEACWSNLTSSYAPTDEGLGKEILATIKPEEERLRALLERQQLDAGTSVAAASARAPRL